MSMVNISIDIRSSKKILNFMDGYSSYNYIFITKEDISKIVFKCLEYSTSLDDNVILVKELLVEHDKKK